MEEKENVSVFGSAIKTGLLIGLCFVLILVLTYIIDVNLLATPWQIGRASCRERV